MSRFGSDPHAFFQSVYGTVAPWEIGAAQPAMAALIAHYPPLDPVVDLGCASGDLAIHLARLGHTVLGLDFVESAVEQANRKRASLPDEIARLLTFHVADASRPAACGVAFGSIFDSGFLHLLDEEEAEQLAAAQRATI